MAIRYGVCAGEDALRDVTDAGFDYIEMNLARLAAMSDDEFDAVAAAIDASDVKAESFNCFFPGGFALVGDALDIDAVNAYVENALSRAARLGGKVAVLGSGGARNIPEGFDRKIAKEQFVSVLRLCGDIASSHGMIIVVEPLHSGETNLINTVDEGLEMQKAAGHDSVFSLADFYHVLMSGEGLDAIKGSGGVLRHVHIAGPNRKYDELKDNRALVSEWMSSLKACNYDGRISLEGHFDDFSHDVRVALGVLKESI